MPYRVTGLSPLEMAIFNATNLTRYTLLVHGPKIAHAAQIASIVIPTTLLITGVAQKLGAEAALFSNIPKSKKLDEKVSKAYAVLLRDYRRINVFVGKDRVLLPYFRKINTKVRQFISAGNDGIKISRRIDKIEKKIKEGMVKPVNKKDTTKLLNQLKKDAKLIEKRMEERSKEFFDASKEYYNERKKLNDMRNKKTKIDKKKIFVEGMIATGMLNEISSIKSKRVKRPSRSAPKEKLKDIVKNIARYKAYEKSMFNLFNQSGVLKFALPSLVAALEAVMSFNKTIQDPTNSKVIGKSFISKTMHARVVSKEKAVWIERAHKKYKKELSYELNMYNSALRDYASSVTELTKWIEKNAKSIDKINDRVKGTDNIKNRGKLKKRVEFLKAQRDTAMKGIENDRKELDKWFKKLREKYDKLEKK